MAHFAFEHTEIYADGADLRRMRMLAGRPDIAGFTTNPTLMRKSGVVDYRAFASEVLDFAGSRPVCFEVLATDCAGIMREARLIAAWAPNVFVKIPVTDINGNSTTAAIRALTASGVRLNVTALMTMAQVETVVESLKGTRGAMVSVFAGRIADTGRDPLPVMAAALERTSAVENVRLLWASAREVLNACQADQLGVDIITLALDMIDRLDLLGRSLDAFSLETVRMLYHDAREAGYRL